MQMPDIDVGPAYIEILQDFSSEQFIQIAEHVVENINDSALSEYV